MIPALSMLQSQACLISAVEDQESSLVIIKPLAHITAAKVYAKGRQSGFGIKINKTIVHTNPSTQKGVRDHV